MKCPVDIAKVDFASLPKTMKNLPVVRGFPVPWFVDWVDGKPEFRAMRFHAYIQAVRERRCWVCGEKTGTSLCFVAGPMCGINRTSSEPPSHPDCGRWSAKNCPFLANPRMVRREDEVINNQSTRDTAAGIALTRNPGVAMLWFTRSYEVFNDGRGGAMIQMGSPLAVEWWREGRPATRSEVQESIDGGLPSLEAVARTESGGLDALNRQVNAFAKWLPQ